MGEDNTTITPFDKIFNTLFFDNPPRDSEELLRLVKEVPIRAEFPKELDIYRDLFVQHCNRTVIKILTEEASKQSTIREFTGNDTEELHKKVCDAIYAKASLEFQRILGIQDITCCMTFNIKRGSPEHNLFGFLETLCICQWICDSWVDDLRKSKFYCDKFNSDYGIPEMQRCYELLREGPDIHSLSVNVRGFPSNPPIIDSNNQGEV
jgi:hypothetical protein